MQGYPAGIDSRNPGRGGDYQPFMGLHLDGMEKGGLASASFACEKDRAIGVLDKVFRQLQFGIKDTHGVDARKRNVLLLRMFCIWWYKADSVFSVDCIQVSFLRRDLVWPCLIFVSIRRLRAAKLGCVGLRFFLIFPASRIIAARRS